MSVGCLTKTRSNLLKSLTGWCACYSGAGDGVKLGDFLKALDHVLALRHPVSAWMRTHESMGTWFSGLAALVASGAALTFSLRQSHQQRQSEARQRDAAEKERNLEAAMLASALLQPTVNLRLEIYRVSLEFEATGSSYMFNGQALEAPVIIHSPLLNVPRVLIERQSEYKLLRDLHGNDLTYVVALCQLYDEQMARAGAEHSRVLGDTRRQRRVSEISELVGVR